MNRVVIAGAGPAGLSLALGLARYGISSTLLERKHDLDPHSRAIVLWPRTLEILQQWGVLESFFADTSKQSVFTVYAAENGKRLTSLDFTCLSDQTAVPYALILPQDRTERLLLDAVRATGLVDVVFDAEVTACVDLGDRVQVGARRSDGLPLTFETAYFVGADGARSFVRSSLGYDLEGKTYPLRTLVADVEIDDERDALPSPRVAVLQRYVLAAVRYAEHSWRMVAVFPQDEIADDADLEALLPQRVQVLLGPGPFVTRWVSLFRTHARSVPHFRVGRVLLMGDAAHINSPTGGQGLNAGIADAHNLAWKVARIVEGGDAERLLQSYDLERRDAIVSSVERFTDRLTNIAILPPKMRMAAISAFDIALRTPARERSAARRIGMLDVPYHGSTLLNLVAERVGRRTPNVVIDGTRLYERLGLSALLLIYHARSAEPLDEEALRHALKDIPALHLLVVDGDRSVARAWNASRSFAALIRPDHYVGWLARSWTTDSLHAGVLGALGS